MRSRITRIWLWWLLVMALLVAVTWALAMVELPGGASGSPTPGDIFGFFAYVGVYGTIRILAVVFLPPIVLTYLEIRKARRDRGL